MTRVSFYILEQGTADARERFVCRLLERIYQEGQRVYAHVPDPLSQGRLDERLWTFRDDSFVPHDHESTDCDSHIVIGSGTQLPQRREVLLNLDIASGEPPQFFASFERMLEIVAGDERERALARQRYGFYRHRGYELQTHKIA